jgi:DNA-binding CsgD family transcriptional regulator/PAS domain-containing protein
VLWYIRTSVIGEAHVISIDALPALVDAIYEAGLDAQRWPNTLAQLIAATGANVADIMMGDALSGASAMFSAGMNPAAIEAYSKHYRRLDPVRPAVEQKPAGTIVTDRDIVSKAWLTRTEFYNDWVRPQDFYDCTMVTLFRDPTGVGVICLAAPERANNFGTQSLELLGRLIPHLARATRLTLKMTNLEALRGASFAALDYLHDAVLLTDSNARVIFANRIADVMLSRGDGIGVDHSGLCAASVAQTTALRRMIALSTRREDVTGAGGSLLLERPSGRRPLSVTVAPMPSDMAWCLGAPPIAIIFVADAEQGGEVSASHLRSLYGMTRAEAMVAGLISKGSGVKAAARELRIAPSTARTHLHRVFNKTGTRRQAELAHLINQIVSNSSPLSK